MATLALAVKLTAYFNGVMHLELADAANELTNFLGTSYIMSILIAILADTYIGRYKAGGCLELVRTSQSSMRLIMALKLLWKQNFYLRDIFRFLDKAAIQHGRLVEAPNLWKLCRHSSGKCQNNTRRASNILLHNYHDPLCGSAPNLLSPTSSQYEHRYL